MRVRIGKGSCVPAKGNARKAGILIANQTKSRGTHRSTVLQGFSARWNCHWVAPIELSLDVRTSDKKLEFDED